MQTFAKFVTKFAKPIVAIWIILFIILAVFALQLPSKLQGDGFSYDGDYQRVTAELSETFGLPASTIFVLFDNKSDEQIERVLTNLEAVEEIDSIAFINVTDSQEESEAGFGKWARVLKDAYTRMPDADFVSHTGSQCFSYSWGN